MQDGMKDIKIRSNAMNAVWDYIKLLVQRDLVPSKEKDEVLSAMKAEQERQKEIESKNG